MLQHMETKDWLTIAAIIIGPILAVQAQKIVENIRERKQRKLTLFRTLMGTRATRLSQEHVAALNMIDIEFYGRKIFGIRFQKPKEKKVTNSWKNYNDHLTNDAAQANAQLWAEKNDQLFTQLLYAMSQALGYDFDEVQIKRDVYWPKGHGDLEEQNVRIRQGVDDLLSGKRPVPVMLVTPPASQPDSATTEDEQAQQSVTTPAQ